MINYNAVDVEGMYTKKCWDNFDSEKKLGHIRCQYGLRGLIANQWIKSEGKTIGTERINVMNSIGSAIMDWVKDYNNIEYNLCEGKEGLGGNEDFFFQLDLIDVWVRVLPIDSGYNCYIYYYEK